MFTFLGLFFGFLVLGVPISLALGVGGLLYLYFTDNWMLVAALPQRMVAGVDQFILLTIPLFLLAGSLMNFGGLSTRMVNFANALVGHFKGGLSLVTVLASMLFAGISGSAIAQSSAIGSLMIPSMTRQGIPAAYSADVHRRDHSRHPARLRPAGLCRLARTAEQLPGDAESGLAGSRPRVHFRHSGAHAARHHRRRRQVRHL